MTVTSEYHPVVIIGAPRSGTNMLRDALTRLPRVATWPCDEINYIWRHGNVRYPSDELRPEHASEPVCRYIHRQFDWVAHRFDAHTVVEKTCANSLRVPFIERVVPEAKYVFIHRNGLDVVGSAMKRWKAELDIPYLARKSRFVPASDLPYYAFRYFWNRVYRIWSREERLAFWGPQLHDMEELLQCYSLEEVCAIQWKRCVELSSEAFRSMPEGKVCTVRYETFVHRPQDELARIVRFLGLPESGQALAGAVSGVTANSIGKGREELGDQTAGRLAPLIEDVQIRLGYT